MKKTVFLSVLALVLLLTGCTAAQAAPLNTAAEIKANSNWSAPATEGDWPADATVDGVLEVLTYADETCDGIPQYYYTAADGTEYAFNFEFEGNGGWVWKNGKEAAVDDETARFIKDNANLLRYEVGTTPAAAVGYTESDRLPVGAPGAEGTGRIALPLFRLDTKADADSFLTDHADLLQFDYEKDGEFPSLRQLLASYDEGFYASNSLLLIYVTASSGSHRYGIASADMDMGTFTLTVDRTDHNEVGTADMEGWALLYEITDEDAAHTTLAYLVMEE